MIKTLQKITNGIKKTANKTRKLILIDTKIGIKNKKIAKRNTKKQLVIQKLP